MPDIVVSWMLDPYSCASFLGTLGEATGLYPPNVGSAYSALLLVNGRLYTRWRSSPGSPGGATGPDIYTTAGSHSEAAQGTYLGSKGKKTVGGKQFDCAYSSAGEWWSCPAGSSGMRYWFRILYEADSTCTAVSSASLSWSPSSPKVYQEFDLSASGSISLATATGRTLDPGTPSVSTYQISSYGDLLARLPGLALEGSLQPTGNRFASAGTKSSLGNKGEGFDYTGIAPSVSVQGFSEEDETLLIEERTPNKRPRAYAGVPIGDGFAGMLRLVRVQKNEYMSYKEAVRTVLEDPISASGISPQVFSVGSTGFDYVSPNGYGQASYAFNVRNVPIGLGEKPFENAGLRKSYYAGETFGEEGESLYAGSLLYADGAYVPLSDIEAGSGEATLQCRESASSPWLSSMEITMETPSPFPCKATWPFPWFGSSALTCEYQASALRQLSPDVKAASLSGAKDYFMAGDPFIIGDGASLLLLGEGGETLIEATGSEISHYVTSWPSGYGSGAVSARDESEQTAYLQVGSLQAEWHYRVGYTESALVVSGPSKRTYYMQGPGTPALDLSGLSVAKRVHAYSNGAWSTSDAALPSGEYEVSAPSFSALDPTMASKKDATVSWDNGFEEASASFEVAAYLLACLSLSWSGSLSESEKNYYDNGADLFEAPSGLSYVRHYNDGSSEEVESPSTEIAYFTGANASVALTPSTPMSSLNGTYVYAKDLETGAMASYQVSFKSDKPTSLYPDPTKEKPELILGNRLSSIRSSLFLKAKWESGLVQDSDYDTWDFADLSIQMEEPSSIEVIDAFGQEFELDADALTYKVPEATLTLDASKVRTAYTNGADSIDLRNLAGSVSYAGAEYKGSVSASFDGLLDEAGEMVPALPEESPLEGVALDGSGELDIDLGEEIEIYPSVPFECLNAFDASKKGTASLSLSVFEISDIDGIALVSARTSYEVGDEFLGEGDTGTVIRLFFTGADGKRRSVQMPLNSRLISLNVYPLAGTVFTSPSESRTVTVSSVRSWMV